MFASQSENWKFTEVPTWSLRSPSARWQQLTMVWNQSRCAEQPKIIIFARANYTGANKLYACEQTIRVRTNYTCANQLYVRDQLYVREQTIRARTNYTCANKLNVCEQTIRV